MKISLSAKNLSEGVTYTPFKKITVTQTEDKMAFTVNNLIKEVTQEVDGKRIKKVKKLKKLLKVSLSVLAVSLKASPTALAATTLSTSPLTQATIMNWGVSVAGLAVATGVVVAMVTLAVAGIYRMFSKKQEADAWSQDIIRGLVQVLISVPAVYLLYFLSKYLFSGLDILKLAL